MSKLSVDTTLNYSPNFDVKKRKVKEIKFRCLDSITNYKIILIYSSILASFLLSPFKHIDLGTFMFIL